MHGSKIRQSGSDSVELKSDRVSPVQNQTMRHKIGIVLSNSGPTRASRPLTQSDSATQVRAESTPVRQNESWMPSSAHDLLSSLLKASSAGRRGKEGENLTSELRHRLWVDFWARSNFWASSLTRRHSLSPPLTFELRLWHMSFVTVPPPRPTLEFEAFNCSTPRSPSPPSLSSLSLPFLPVSLPLLSVSVDREKGERGQRESEWQEMGVN